MTKARVISINPRIVNQSRLAEYLGKSKGWLCGKLPDLQERGFPKRLPHVDGYDLRAVDSWLDSLTQDDELSTDWKARKNAFE